MTDPVISRRTVGGLLFGAGATSLLQCTMGEDQPPKANESTDRVTSALTGGARIDLASSLGITTGANKAQANSIAYITWRDAGNANGSHTLIFDTPGLYEFFPEVLSVPSQCKLAGVYGVTLKCIANPDGGTHAWFVRCKNGGGNIYIDDLTFDGNGQVDVVIELGKAPDLPTGVHPYLNGVTAKNAVVACISGFNSAFNLLDCATDGGPVGFLFDGCGESVGHGLTGQNHSDCAIRIRGSLINGNGAPNGGRVSLYRVRTAGTCNYGIDLESVSQTDIHGLNVAGSLAAVRIRDKSTNIRIMGLRVWGGGAVAVEFNACNNAHVWGGCGASQKVVYKNDARGCRAYMAAETVSGHVDIRQEWGTAPWLGHVRGDGTVLGGGLPTAQNDFPAANAEVSPTDGFWERGDQVFKRSPAGGGVMGWVCTSPGNPGTWKAMPNLAT